MVTRYGCSVRSLAALATYMALTVSCTSVASAPNADLNFAGSWSYTKTCESGHYVNLELRQSGAHVSGEWSSGTQIRGSDGQLDGTIRDNKLHVRYCSDDDESGYAICPNYGAEEDYFVLREGALVRYQKFGKDFKQDISLHPNVAGKKVRIDTQGCDLTEEK